MRRCVHCQGEGRIYEARPLARSFHQSHINYFVDTKSLHSINWCFADLRPSAAPSRIKRERQLLVSFKSMRLKAANKDHQREHQDREEERRGQSQRQTAMCFQVILFRRRVPLRAPALSGPWSRRSSCICSPSPAGRWWSSHLIRADNSRTWFSSPPWS